MIKLITFDYWNTIFDSSNGIERNALRKDTLVEQLSNYNFTLSQIDTIIKGFDEYFHNIWVNENRTPCTMDMINYIWDKHSIENNSAIKKNINQIFEEAVLIYPPQLNPGAKEAIDKLEKQYILGIVSDTGFSPGSILKSLLNSEDMLHYFSYFSFSNETGFAKPASGAFQKILNDASINAYEAIHIGDIERTDIVGAKSIGMKAVKYEGDETSKIYNKKDDKSLADYISNNWNDIYEWILENDR